MIRRTRIATTRTDSLVEDQHFIPILDHKVLNGVLVCILPPQGRKVHLLLYPPGAPTPALFKQSIGELTSCATLEVVSLLVGKSYNLPPRACGSIYHFNQGFTER